MPVTQTENNLIIESLPDMELCPVQGGEFMMRDENGKEDDEKPAHRVTLAGFYIGRFPVTQQLWEAVTGENPSRFKGEKQPVESVSRQDVHGFLGQLNGRQDVREFLRQLDYPGMKFRLPTEAEWEYAARGGIYSQGYEYSGSDKLKQVGWYNDNSDNKTHEVGLLLPNELGLHDMSGNVFEWCYDWYDGNYYGKCQQQGTVANPQGAEKGEDRVLRGGCFILSSLYCRSVPRYDFSPEFRDFIIGVRLVLSSQSVG